jgi:hypothetical protein
MLRRKKKPSGSRRIQLDDATADAWVAGLIDAAAEIRLPELFARPHKDSIFSVDDRHGISVTTLRTTSLGEQQLRELMRFRMAQYLEVNFVDANVVYQKRLEHEPLDAAKPNDVHVIAGTKEGEIICYAVMKSPPDTPPGTTLRTRERALMPVEEVHGWGVFNRLPIVPDLPLSQLRELGRFVKNQRYKGADELGIRGPVEVGVAIFRMIAETLSFELSAVVGDLEEGVAKQNLDFFHVPLVILHGTMPVEGDDSWLLPRYLYRTVVPFACLATDAATALPRLAQIEQALGRPGKLGLLSLMRLRSDAGAEVRSSLQPEGGFAALSDEALPQKGVAMAERREVVEAGSRLRETELFASLSPAEAAVLGTFLTQVEVEPETVIVRQGDPADSLYIVAAGEVEVRNRMTDGESKAVATIGAGDYFGEIGVLSGGARIADVVAVEPTTLLRLSKDDYERYLSQVVEVDHELERTAGRRAAEAARRLLDAQNKPE